MRALVSVFGRRWLGRWIDGEMRSVWSLGWIYRISEWIGVKIGRRRERYVARSCSRSVVRVDMLSLVRSVPPRGLSSRGDKLYIISGHVKSDRWCLPSRAAGFEKVVSQPANKLRSGQPRTEWVCRRVMSTTARKKVIGDDVLDS